MYSRSTRPSGRVVARGLAMVLALGCAPDPSPGCSSGGGGGDVDDGGQPGEDNVSLFTTSGQFLLVTGAASSKITSLRQAIAGFVLLNDEVSGSVVRLETNRSISLYTDGDDLTDLSGENTASLGPLAEVAGGNGAGEFFGADAVSGLLFRLRLDGSPVIHATKAQIQFVTGAADSRMRLPRFLTSSQVIAQDTVTNDIILFGTSQAAPQMFVDAVELAFAAGVLPSQATVAGWARSRVFNSALFARFATTNNIVKVTTARDSASPHALGSDLETIFPNVPNLRVLDFVADTQSDFLLIIIGTGNRGVAVAVANEIGAVAVFTGEATLAAVLGNGYDLTGIGVLADGVPYAIDRGNLQVIVFDDNGAPIVVGTREAILDAASAAAPELSISVPIGNESADRGVILPEASAGEFLLVE